MLSDPNVPRGSITPPRELEPCVAPEPGARPGAILIVDDEPAILNISRRILTRAGYRTLCALSGPEAVALLQESRDDVLAVLLDMSMPGMSGRETLVALRQVTPELKVMLSSGHPEAQARNQFAGQALDGFLKKPYGQKQLLELVASVLH